MTAPMNDDGLPTRAKPLSPQDPRWFGEFRTTAVLGEGGMGRVYLGRDRNGRLVAIKAIRGELARDEQFRARFRREADSALKVPSYVTAEVLAADPDAPIPYLVTEYIDGPTLQELVTGGAPLRGAELHQLAVAMATALKGVHGAGIMHRDLKPGNVLLSRLGPRVIDFGIARTPEATRFTAKGKAMGTPAYMAPEQLLNDPSPASDVFAWGGVMVFAATGHRPFPGTTMHLVVDQIMNAEPDLGGLPGRLRTVVAAAMRKDAAARPTADQLLEMLGTTGELPVADPLLMTRQETAEPPADTMPAQFGTSTYVPPKPRRRRRLVRLLTALVVPTVVAGALVAWAAWEGRQADLLVTAVDVEVDDPRPGCGDEVNVTGTLTTNGARGEITYQWWRSDKDAPEPPRSQVVEEGGSRTTVHLLWGIEGTGRHRFRATLTVLGETPLQGATTFTYSCRK